MKSIKTLTIAAISGLMILLSVTSESNAFPKVRVYAGPKVGFVVSKPGPNFVWIDGHYKINRYGKLVWVPGYWKRV